ncbi:hypothetical protein HKX48_007668, partial [Thoreauomyces humboldtii]
MGVDIHSNLRDSGLAVVYYKFDATGSLQESMQRWPEKVIAHDAVPLHAFALSNIPGAFIIITDVDVRFVNIVRDGDFVVITLPSLRISPESPEKQTIVAAASHEPTCDLNSTTTAIQSLYVGTDQGHLFRLDFDRNLVVTPHHVIDVERSIQSLSVIPIPGDREGACHLFVEGDGCDGVIISACPKSGAFVEAAWPNWAPDLDFAVADVHREGHDTLLLTSGTETHGDIREIRSGIAAVIHTKSNSGMVGARALFTLKRRASDMDDAALVISFVDETRVMILQENELVDATGCGFDRTVPTLHAANFGDGLHVQIHPRGLVVMDLFTSDGRPQTWDPGSQKVVGGCVNGDMILISIAESVVLLQAIWAMESSDPQLVEVRRISLNFSPSCFYATCLPRNSPSSVQRICVVGTYEQSVLLLSMEPETCLELLHRESLAFRSYGSVSVPHSFQLQETSSGTRLLAGTRDGLLATYSLSLTAESAPGLALQLRSVCQAGILPVSLVSSSSLSSSQFDALALSNTAWRVTDSAHGQAALVRISCPRIISAAPFRYAGIEGGCMVLVKSGLEYLELDEGPKCNLRRVPLGQGPRRILYDETTRRAVVAVTVRSLGYVGSELLVIDPISGKIFFREALQRDEKILALAEWNVKEGKRYICAGTWGFRQDLDPKIQHGRVLVYSLKAYERKEKSSEDKKVVMYKMKLLGEIVLDGPVQSICSFLGSYLLAAVGDVFYQLKIDAHTRKLVLRTSVTARWPIQCISVAGNRVIMGGQKESVSFWNYDPESRSFSFDQSDRYARPIADCIAADDDVAIASDKCGNLFGFTS